MFELHSSASLVLQRDAGRKLAREMTADSDALAAELRKKIQGEVRFENGTRALYATDASINRSPSFDAMAAGSHFRTA